MQKFSQWFSKLSPAIQMAFIVIVLFLIWRIYKWAAPTITQYAKKSEIEILQAQGQQPSYSDYEYNAIADALQESMEGIGTYNEDLMAEFRKLNNTVDFIKTDTAFGVRSAADNLFGLIPPSDLTGWVRDDLKDTPALLAQLNKMFADKGIKKSF